MVLIKSYHTVNNQLVFPFGRIIPFGSVGLVLALALTVPLDTLMWKHDWWLWPEGYVIYYNVILNMSHNWGTMPWAWYFYSAIPR